jgi:hypothetical protein
MIILPGAPPQPAAMEMISISAVDQQDFPSEGYLIFPVAETFDGFIDWYQRRSPKYGSRV